MEKKIYKTIHIEDVDTSILEGGLLTIVNNLESLFSSQDEKYINLRFECEYDYDEFRIMLFGDRLETDTEFNARIKRLNASRVANKVKKEKREALEKAELERLKRKYENAKNKN